MGEVDFFATFPVLFAYVIVPILIIIIVVCVKKNNREKAIQNINSYMVEALRKRIGSDINNLSKIVLEEKGADVKMMDGKSFHIMYNGYEFKGEFSTTKKLRELAQSIISSYPLPGFSYVDGTYDDTYTYSNSTVTTIRQYKDTIEAETHPDTTTVTFYRVIIERDSVIRARKEKLAREKSSRTIMV